MSQSLHIVSFDVPYPANYGGVIDVYWKLFWLKKAGVKITLHCFQYGRPSAAELESLCEKVFYYPRKTGLFANLSLLPYTVVSRRSAELERNLLADDHPILFEVLHTCYLLKDERFKTRKKIYRHSNIEHEYYAELSRSERNFVKKIYLKIEAMRLKKFESILQFADLILAVNKKDTEYFTKKFRTVRSVYLPSFHPNSTLSIRQGKGEYILFHGNLSISENYDAATWLIKNVFSKIDHKVIIAGLNPPDFLKELVRGSPQIELKNSPPEKEMDELILGAQIHVLYTAQPTGLKLKLLNVLFKGRYIVCNAHMLAGTALQQDNTLVVENTGERMKSKINELMSKPFTRANIAERERQAANFDNVKNAEQLIVEIFECF